MVKRYININIVVCFVFDWKLFLSCYLLMVILMFGKILICGFFLKEFNICYKRVFYFIVKSFFYRLGDKFVCDLYYV